MPLLRKRPFVRNESPSNLKPSDKVFYCEMTSEVFTHYEEFWERLVLCNSMVWCCELTGRPNLTYLEAVECESRARRCLSKFSQLLRRPILYLASLTRRGRFIDLNEDVFAFVRDRYFVGEEVEAIVHNHWYDCKVTRVILPTPEEVEKYLKDIEESDAEMEEESKKVKVEEGDVKVIEDVVKSKNTEEDEEVKVIKEVKKESKEDEEEKKVCPPPFATFKYEVIELDPWDYKERQSHIVGWEQIRRNKGVVTREKCKLFLKQCVMLSAPGFWVIKEKVASLHRLADTKFSDIFPGPEPKFMETRAKKMPLGLNPDFVAERRRERKEAREGGTDGKKRGRPPLTDEEKEAKKKMTKEAKEAREEVLAEQKEKLRQKLEKDKEERQKERQIKKEEKRLRLQYIKEWNRAREDLDCDDHKDLPQPTPVLCGIPDQEFSNFMTVLEFVNNFWEVLEVKDVYPQGITFEMLETGLLEKEVAGVFSDLLQLLLQALFTLQEEEDDEVKEDASEDLGLDGESRDLSVKEAVRVANRTTTWTQYHHGYPLQKLQLDALTLTEVLRLHLLASGATCGANARWRHFNRGGYKHHDDPGLHFKLQESQLLNKLNRITVFDLSIGHKLKILNVLIGQILTYASLRDAIDDNIEELKKEKNGLRLHQQTVGRYEKEILAARLQEKRDHRQKEREKMLKAMERKEQKQGEEAAQTLPCEERKEEDDDADEEEEEEEEEEESEDEAGKTARQEREARNNESRRQELRRREAELIQKVLSAGRGVSTAPLGQDRAYRRYWVFSSLVGLFVEDFEPHPGSCRATPTPQHPNSLAMMMEERELAIREEACHNLAHTHTPDTVPTSNKENAGPIPLRPPVPTHPPSRPLHLANGAQSGIKDETQQDKKEEAAPVFGLCTANSETCSVHAPSPTHHRWHFFHNPNQLPILLAALNPRGHRERRLRSNLTALLPTLQTSLKACPINRLNPNLSAMQEMEGEGLVRKSQRHTGPAAKKDTNLNFPLGTPMEEVLKVTLTDIILETEDKLHLGMLGSLQQPLQREEWRKALVSGTLPLTPLMDYGGKKRLANLRTELDQDSDEAIKPEDEDAGDAMENVKQLCHGILHLSRAVDPKFLQHPLGETDKARRTRERAEETYLKSHQKEEEDANSSGEVEEDEEIKNLSSLLTPLERWENSLMASTNLSQLCLHFATLDNSISWAHSVANTRCRVCRRKTDPESILLCDGCNKGTHLQCLKPKLKEVPDGDWFCDHCRPKERPKSPRKKRQIYCEESDEEEEEQEEYSDVCYTCCLPGTLICCDTCPLAFHPECVALRKVPRGSWSCSHCTSDSKGKDTSDDKKRNNKEVSKGSKDGGKNKTTPKSTTPKSASVKKNSKATTPKMVTSKSTPKSSSTSKISPKTHKNNASLPIENRKRRGEGETPHSAKRTKRDSPARRLSGRRSLVNEMSNLNTTALNSLLEELQRYPESCHFNKPVSKKLAPDYYEVVRKPMDFGRVRDKLSSLKYSSDGEFLADVMLIFQNCQQYNLEDTPQYRAGSLLSDLFMSRVSELGLPLPHISPSSGRKRRR